MRKETDAERHGAGVDDTPFIDIFSFSVVVNDYLSLYTFDFRRREKKAN